MYRPVSATGTISRSSPSIGTWCTARIGSTGCGAGSDPPSQTTFPSHTVRSESASPLRAGPQTKTVSDSVRTPTVRYDCERLTFLPLDVWTPREYRQAKGAGECSTGQGRCRGRAGLGERLIRGG
jgi:hypothetical protein